MMRLALHIFRKDVERLWPVVLVTLGLLGLFVYYDANHPMYVWRATFPQGTWLDLVLPFAWCFLAALAILQDSLVGDGQFWVALPCNWRTLLLAKVTFIASTIALPYLLATGAILIARGFNPFLYVPDLLWRQLLLLAVLIPAVALATLAKNIGQFLLAEITVLSVLMFLGNPATEVNAGPEFFPWDVRWALALTILVAGGIVVVAGQFIARRTLVLRMVAVAIVICAAALYNEMSRDTSAAIRASFPAAPETRGKLSARFSPDDTNRTMLSGAVYTRNRTAVLIPLKFSGTFDRLTRIQIISLTMMLPDGGHYEAAWPGSPDAVRAQRISAFLLGPSPDGDAWLNVQIFNDAVERKLLSGPVVLSGHLLAESYQAGPATPIPQSSWIDAPGVGRCVLNQSEDPLIGGEHRVVTAECESPNLSAPEMGVTSRRFGGLPLRDLPSLTPGGLGANAWLSPLHRGAQILFPNYAEADAAWSVAALHPQGSATVDFTIPNLKIADYILHDPTAGAAK